MRPLRPAIDHCLGRPLPYQLANQPRPPLQAHCCFDLAMLCGISPGFPELFPTRRQVVTCYSPGRHCTHGLLHFLVRLACVRHAASVDSEPGSNSRLKPEICSERTNSPSARRPTAYFVSTFRLLARTFLTAPARTKLLQTKFRHDARITRTDVRATLTTGTFNQLSKTEDAVSRAGPAPHFSA